MISDERLKVYAEWEPVDDDQTQKEVAGMAAELLRRREADRWIPITTMCKPDLWEEVYLADFDGEKPIYGFGFRHGEEEFIGITCPTHFHRPPQRPEST
jgi:hypothetical protein